jgi:serine/threonine-protein kinase RsbW
VPDKLRMTAGLKDLEHIRHFVEEHAAQLGAGTAAIDDLVLAVDEAAANSIEHGYQGSPGLLEVEISRRDDKIVVVLRDEAPPFDPTEQPPPDLTLPLDERPIGGVGIHLARQVLDIFSYRRTDQGKNELTLARRVER